MKTTTRIKNISWLSCVLAGIAVAPPFAHASFAPFTHVRVDLDREDLVTGEFELFDKEISSDFAQVGSSPYFAKARASFGETGSFAMVTGRPADNHAHAESSWSDAFTIVGSTGTGILSVSVQIEGSLTGAGANSIYALFASETPITLGDENLGTGLQGFAGDNYPVPPDGSRTVIGVYESISGSNIYTADIPFTYGTTFYIASHLGAEVWWPDGTADFYGSSRFGATAPNGGVITGASGTAYALAAAVPEPSAHAMVAVGLLTTLSVSARSRRKI